MRPDSVQSVGWFGFGLMAVGFLLLSIGLAIATGAGFAEDDPGPLVIGITLAGLALFIAGAMVEIRDWFQLRSRR